MIKLSDEDVRSLMQNCTRVIAADLSWLIHKNFHAMPNLTSVVDGQVVRTGHYFGVSRFVTSIRSKFPGSFIAFCADSFPEEKVKIYPDYKKGRQREFDLKAVTISVLKMLSYLNGVVGVVAKGVEADEVMYSVVKSCGLPSIVFSGDNDLLQAIDPERNIVLSRKIEDGRFVPIDQEYVDKKFGVPIKDILYYRVLVGDPSDGIPEVYTKREAAEIMAQYTDLDSFLEGSYKVKELERNLQLMQLKEVPVTYWKAERGEALAEAVRLGQRSVQNLIWKG